MTGGRFNFLRGAGLTKLSSSVTAQTSNLTVDTVRIGVNHTFN